MISNVVPRPDALDSTQSIQPTRLRHRVDTRSLEIRCLVVLLFMSFTGLWSSSSSLCLLHYSATLLILFLLVFHYLHSLPSLPPSSQRHNQPSISSTSHGSISAHPQTDIPRISGCIWPHYPFWSFLYDGIRKLFYPTMSGWLGNVSRGYDPHWTSVARYVTALFSEGAVPWFPSASSPSLLSLVCHIFQP